MTYLIKLCQREEITWLFPQTKVHHHPISAAPAAVHLTSAKLQHLLVKGGRPSPLSVSPTGVGTGV